MADYVWLLVDYDAPQAEYVIGVFESPEAAWAHMHERYPEKDWGHIDIARHALRRSTSPFREDRA